MATLTEYGAHQGPMFYAAVRQHTNVCTVYDYVHIKWKIEVKILSHLLRGTVIKTKHSRRRNSNKNFNTRITPFFLCSTHMRTIRRRRRQSIKC